MQKLSQTQKVNLSNVQQVSKLIKVASRVQCQAQQNQVSQKKQNIVKETLSAGLIAASILTSGPSTAGLVIQEPIVKSIFYEGEKKISELKDTASEVQSNVSGGFSLPSFSLPGQPKPSPPTPPSSTDLEDELPTPEFNTAYAAVPVTIGILAAAATLQKFTDPTFEDFWREGLLNDSNELGIGYEVDVKTQAGVLKEQTGTTKTVKAYKGNALERGAQKLGLSNGSTQKGSKKGSKKDQPKESNGIFSKLISFTNQK